MKVTRPELAVATYNCPKCGGKTFTTHPHPGVNTNKCAQCGLYYDIGGNKESLRKQILGEAYVNPLGGIK